jgi:hypothetical protein
MWHGEEKHRHTFLSELKALCCAYLQAVPTGSDQYSTVLAEP